MRVSHVAVMALGGHDFRAQLALPKLLPVGHSAAGHAYDMDILSFKLGLCYEHDNVFYVASLCDNRGPAEGLDVLELPREIDREVVNAQRVPYEPFRVLGPGYENGRGMGLPPVPAVADNDL